MVNYVGPGQTGTLTLGASANVGDPILIGQKLVVVYSTDNLTASAVSGETVTVAHEGRFILKKGTAASSGGAQGAFAYWVPSTSRITADSTVSGAVKIGSFFATCADADNTCEVKLFPS